MCAIGIKVYYNTLSKAFALFEDYVFFVGINQYLDNFRDDLDGIGHEIVAWCAAEVGGAWGDVHRVVANKGCSQKLLQATILRTAEHLDFLRHPFNSQVLGIEEKRDHTALSLAIRQKPSCSPHALHNTNPQTRTGMK